MSFVLVFAALIHIKWWFWKRKPIETHKKCAVCGCLLLIEVVFTLENHKNIAIFLKQTTSQKKQYFLHKWIGLGYEAINVKVFCQADSRHSEWQSERKLKSMIFVGIVWVLDANLISRIIRILNVQAMCAKCRYDPLRLLILIEICWHY